MLVIFWYATRTGRRLHLATLGSGRSLCNRAVAELICLAVPGRDRTRHLDQRRTCTDCRRVAGYIATATKKEQP